jgi:hypothetical protein
MALNHAYASYLLRPIYPLAPALVTPPDRLNGDEIHLYFDYKFQTPMNKT